MGWSHNRVCSTHKANDDVRFKFWFCLSFSHRQPTQLIVWYSLLTGTISQQNPTCLALFDGFAATAEWHTPWLCLSSDTEIHAWFFFSKLFRMCRFGLHARKKTDDKLCSRKLDLCCLASLVNCIALETHSTQLKYGWWHRLVNIMLSSWKSAQKNDLFLYFLYGLLLFYLSIVAYLLTYYCQKYRSTYLTRRNKS